jgi:hypothetical protein
VVGGLALLVLVLVVVLASTGGSSPSRHSATGSRPPSASSIPAVEAGLLPWTLDAPLSREVVLPGSGSNLTVLGGLSASNASLPRVFYLDTATGHIAEAGSLPAGRHDAAGAQFGASDVLMGGGTPTTVADNEQFTPAAGSGHGSALAAGQLPQPRSDATAVSVGSTTYVVGGYDGVNPDAQVVATTDGRHFSTVASLPLPVRYPAVAALDGRIYVFGGQSIGGARHGPVDAVQMVDPATHSATRIGHLPRPIMGAAAAVIGGHVYVAGGVTDSSAGVGSGSTGSGSTGTATDAQASTAVSDVLAFDPVGRRLLHAGSLPAPIAYTGVQVQGQRAWLLGGENGGSPVPSVEMFTPNPGFGTAGASGAGSPYYGAKLLVADRGNDRILLLDNDNRLVWSYPSSYAAAPPGGFYFPDDAFFARHGTAIVSNQENNQTIVIIGFPSGQMLWQYGHPRVPGSSANFLHTPDDAYLLRNGQVTIADAANCRVLFINPDKTVARQIGTNGVCRHSPPADLGSPNGDTPLANGNVLISEINGQWVSEYTPSGQLVWTVHLPVGYPSDAQQLGPDLYLLSDYSHPGAIVEFNREGQVLYKYSPQTGPGELNQPSLTELLPSGVFMTNDDYRHRMVAIDPATQALVWQYGTTDVGGSAPGMLNTPDGFDLLLPNGSTPTHAASG